MVFSFLDSNVMRILSGGDAAPAAPAATIAVVAAAAATAAAALPPFNITNEKSKIREIIFYPVATKIDKFQARAHTARIMLCHSHRNLIGDTEKYQMENGKFDYKLCQKSIPKKTFFLYFFPKKMQELSVCSYYQCCCRSVFQRCCR